jgi:hypothetical protein
VGHQQQGSRNWVGICVRRHDWVKHLGVLCFCIFLLLEHTCSGCNLFILIPVSRVQVMEVVNGPEFGSPNSVRVSKCYIKFMC